MSPLKQILLAALIMIPLGLLIGMSVTYHEVIDPPNPYPIQNEKIVVWSGTIGDQEIEITQKR